MHSDFSSLNPFSAASIAVSCGNVTLPAFGGFVCLSAQISISGGTPASSTVWFCGARAAGAWGPKLAQLATVNATTTIDNGNIGDDLIGSLHGLLA